MLCLLWSFVPQLSSFCEIKWCTAGAGPSERAAQMAENSFSRVLTNFGLPRKINFRCYCEQTHVEFSLNLGRFWNFTIASTGLSVHPFPLSPSSSFKVCSFWMSRFYEWSDKGKGGMKGREGRRGGGQREGGVGGDEFTVYNTRLECVQERFLYVWNVWIKVFISESNLSSPVRFLQKLMGTSSIWVVIKSFRADDGGRRGKD